jgi:hypothetical protein
VVCALRLRAGSEQSFLNHIHDAGQEKYNSEADEDFVSPFSFPVFSE